jgi:hypothetical protein
MKVYHILLLGMNFCETRSNETLSAILLSERVEADKSSPNGL